MYEDRVNKAVELFMSGYNCSQSVVAAFADLYGFTPEQALRMSASFGGGIGRMPGNSVERDFLSQAFSDFIFAIIIEEMGLWGAIIVVFLYLVLMFRAGRIASRCERNFPAFLIMGLALLLVFQAFTNMLVAVGILPVTGQPLPLISRGGTSTIITCAYFGMMLSVSRYARKTDTRAEQQQNTDLAQAEFQNDKDLV